MEDWWIPAVVTAVVLTAVGLIGAGICIGLWFARGWSERQAAHRWVRRLCEERQRDLDAVIEARDGDGSGLLDRTLRRVEQPQDDFDTEGRAG